MDSNNPTILLLINDLIFETKIRSTARAIGLEVETARSAAAFGKAVPLRSYAGFIVDLDAGPDAIDAIQATRSSPTCPELVAFGSHVQTELLAAARQAGADQVMPRSRFAAELPAMLTMLMESQRDRGPQQGTPPL